MEVGSVILPLRKKLRFGSGIKCTKNSQTTESDYTISIAAGLNTRR